MSKIEVDAIDKQSGSTLTLGGSGTAVTLACGATQTGFGRTGSVRLANNQLKLQLLQQQWRRLFCKYLRKCIYNELTSRKCWSHCCSF
jgi:hypothetical protein